MLFKYSNIHMSIRRKYYLDFYLSLLGIIRLAQSLVL